MSKVINALFAASAFSIVPLTLAILRYLETSNLCDIEFVAYLLVFILLSFLAWLIVLGVRAMGEEMYIENIKKVESNASAIVPFIASFSAPGLLKTFEFDFSVIRLAFGILLIIGFVTMYVPVHPLLMLLGFHFYKAETDDGVVFTLVTNRSIRSKDTIRRVVRVSDSLYFEGKHKC